MSFDPITMALCKGDASAGDTSLPYVLIETPLTINEDLSDYNVTLTSEERDALHSAYVSMKPAMICVKDFMGSGLIGVAILYSGTGFIMQFLMGVVNITFVFSGDGLISASGWRDEDATATVAISVLATATE